MLERLKGFSCLLVFQLFRCLLSFLFWCCRCCWSICRLKKPPATQNFLLLASARTGSNLLKDLLGGHSKVVCHGEIFNSDVEEFGGFDWARSYSWRRQLHVSTHFNRPLCSTRTTVGFKVFLSQLEDMNLSLTSFLEFLPSASKVVVLYRENILERYVSLKIAEKTQVWYADTLDELNKTQNETIEVDPKAFVGFAENEIEVWTAALEQLKASKTPFFITSYEELVANRPGVMSELFAFLGLSVADCVRTRPHCLRQNPDPLEKKISNFDKVRKILQNFPQLQLHK
jgi:LPS sulfotransferase NodH